MPTAGQSLLRRFRRITAPRVPSCRSHRCLLPMASAMSAGRAGMSRPLHFGFDGHSDNPHLPDNYISNTVVYTGTHDNPPTREWYEELPASQRHFLWRYLNRPEGRSTDAAPALIELAWSSSAACDSAVARCAQPRSRGPDECPWADRGQLALAMHARHADADSLPMAP